MSGNDDVTPVSTAASGYINYSATSNDTVIKYKGNITGSTHIQGANNKSIIS